MEKNLKKYFVSIIIASILISSSFGLAGGFFASGLIANNKSIKDLVAGSFNQNTQGGENEKIFKVSEESAVISVVEKASPAVVSVIVTKNLPVWERYYSDAPNGFFDDFFGMGDFFNFSQPQYRQKGTEKQEIGGGTGFVVSSDGYIVTNKHVVEDEEAEYTVLMNSGEKYEAKVLARDTITDLAVLKVEKTDLPFVELGDSSDLKVGQTVVAIGNALAEFRNTVSTGVISGLSRSVVAGGAGIGSEQLTGVIQTDASINPGNSGGPLLNLAGQVIGINTAMASGAENIGFAIPVNEIKNSVESVKASGKIIRPWLGVRYVLLDKEIAKQNNLDIDYGALIVRGDQRTDLAVIPGSPADKAGLVENDIIMEVEGVKIDSENTLTKIINKFKVGDEISIKLQHKGEEKELKLKLEEMR